MSKTILSVYSQKGGTGKTSLSVLLSLYASELGKRVLIVDLDPQKSLTLCYPNKSDKTVFHWLTEQTDCIQTINTNVSIIRGDLQLIKLQSGLVYNQIHNLLTGLVYDLIILDLSPTYNNLIVSSLYASDNVLIPTLQSEFDLESLLFTLDTIQKVKPACKKTIVFNRQNKPTKEIEKMFLLDKDISSNPICYFPNTISIRKAIKKQQLTEKLSNQIQDVYRCCIHD
jgi:cellulose biosynthesis protein BcsQ